MLVFMNRNAEQRLKECKVTLVRLANSFADATMKQENSELSENINAVDQYYYDLCVKAKSSESVEHVVRKYELFVEQLEQVKNGTLLDSQAIQNAELKCNQSRNLKVGFYNLFKACESMSWLATAVTLGAGLYAIALPLMLTTPAFGVIVGLSLVGLLIKAAHKALSCLTEFKSNNQHKKEFAVEKSLISFFSTTPPEQKSNEPTSKRSRIEAAPYVNLVRSNDQKEKTSGTLHNGASCC